MALAVPQTQANTIDNFFKKITKKKSVDNEKVPPPPDNSDSEFELFYEKKKSNPKNDNTIITTDGTLNQNYKKNEDSSSSVNTDSDSKDLNLLDSSSKSLKKAAHSNTSFLKPSGSVPNENQGIQKLETKRNEPTVKVSPAKMKISTSHTLSDDEESSNEKIGGGESLPQPSSDEEFIPATQDISATLSLQFDLGTGKRNSTLEEASNSAHDSESEDSDSSTVDSNKKTDAKPSSTDSPLFEGSWFSELTSKMSEVRQLNKTADVDFLCKENISEDEELYIIQCPTKIDPKSFYNKEIVLDQMSSLKLKTNDETIVYDYVTVMNNTKRLVDLILPSKNLTELHIEKLSHAGNIILSESIDVPKLKKPPISPAKRVEYPEKLEGICLSLPVADAPSDSSSSYCGLSELITEDKVILKAEGDPCEEKKNKKKKHKNKDATFSEDVESFSQSTTNQLISSLERKKKKSKDENILNETTDFYSEKKKKRKRSVAFSDEEKVMENPNYSACDEPVIFSKKKKKKHKDAENTSFLEDYPLGSIIKTEPAETCEEIDTPPVTHKKKKKKSREYESYSLENSLKIKSEPEETNVLFESFQEDDSLILNKKKKKKSKSKSIGE